MLLKFKPLKWAFSGSYFTSICISSRGANIWDKTTDFHTLGNAYHCQAQLPEGPARPDHSDQANCLFPQLETLCTLMEKTGNDWNCVWFGQLTWMRERDQHEFCPVMSENLALGSTLNSLPIWLWLEFRYINQISLLWLLLSHISLHLIKSMKFGRTKKAIEHPKLTS